MDPLCIELGSTATAPATARHALQSWLATVECAETFLDDAMLIVSELVTNVVIHTESASLVTATFEDHWLRIEVHDRTPGGPVVASAPTGAGRGLLMLEAHCDVWGWEPTPFGKRVWAETLH